MSLMDILVSQGCSPKLAVTKINNGYEIEYGQMYEAPDLSFDSLKELSDLFGTTNINVDHYSVSGCETCDFYSDYGHTIQITNITKNRELLDELVNRGNLYDRS